MISWRIPAFTDYEEALREETKKADTVCISISDTHEKKFALMAPQRGS
jgi:hypothetical protein